MNASEKTEMEAQHEADWLVWKDAPMPHLTKGSGDNTRALSAIYGKAAPSKTPYQD